MADNRNPSPPPEEGSFEAGDQIGETAYSKRFVLNTLLDLLKMSEESDSSAEETELDSEREDVLCQLWDMSVDSQVSRFLLDSDCFTVFSRTLWTENKPRLTEILIGILANIASDSDNLSVLLQNEDLPDLCFSILRCRDTPTLVETARLLATVIQMEKWTREWNEKFDTMSVWEDVSFIISSNTNATLLLHLSVIIDGLIENEEAKILEKLLSNSPESWNCLLESMKELLKAGNFQACSSYIHCFQSLSVSEKGAMALALHGVDVLSVVLSCVECISRNFSESDAHLNSLSSAFLIFRSIVTKQNWQELININPNFLNVLLIVAQKLNGQKSDEALREDTFGCISCLGLLCEDLSAVVPGEESNHRTVLSEILLECCK